MAVRLVTIVEGKGELQALPVLIRRILAEINVHDATIIEPVRVRRDKLLKHSDNELSRALSLAIAKLGNTAGTILILIDSEGACPVDISRDLHNRAHAPHVQMCRFMSSLRTLSMRPGFSLEPASSLVIGA